MNGFETSFVVVFIVVAAVAWTHATGQPSHRDEFVLPPESGVTNVRELGAVGDGVHDDTAAIQEAYNRTGLIYFPNGIYLVSETIKPPPRPGGVPSRRIIQGQSRDGVVIRLKDRAAGFSDPAKPKPILVTSWKVAQAFRNAVRDVTFDVGAGNPGAVGLEFFASNTGQIWNVAIRSSDPQAAGHAGLRMVGDNGPLLVRELTVEGFDYGVYADCNQLATFEHINLSGQHVVGFASINKSIVRNLKSDNTVTAVEARGQGFTLLGADLRATTTTNQPAVRVEGNPAVLLREVRTVNYAEAVRSKDQAVVAAAVEQWTSRPPVEVGDHLPLLPLRDIAETPETPIDPPAAWVPVTRFQPGELFVERKGRHRKENWASALQAAIDSGASTIYFPAGRAYPMHGEVRIRGQVRRIIGLEAPVGQVDATLSGARLIIEDGVADTVFIERFDSMYSMWHIENRSKRRLVLRHLMAHEITLSRGAGDLFLDDIYTTFLDIQGQTVWARGLNMEHSIDWAKEPKPRPNCRNVGGKLWLLGLKTEQARTKVHTTAGGTTEVYGYILANVASNPLPMFINEDSTTAVSVVESVLRQGPFSVLLRNHCGTTQTDADRATVGVSGTTGAWVPLLTAGCAP